ncbi:class I SAM-dependent methyltransferase [Halomarina oriensis]|uniref:Methyltransferase domain-containing protein n=1 Tax=Halomarina oriensis TaxID=671145 RepID=A0A6B0GKM7_9EURY|nr:class I SAM-dependent methyltransferase [Halomarina oriensis]MWG35170.1 methyltransferase domain-containing protein [Halomarina oriensis]
MDDPVSRTLAAYEGLAPEYRERHDDRSVVAESVERFDRALADARESGPLTTDRPARVLDVGCGPGWEAATFADRGHDVTAVDLTPAFLDQAGEVAPNAARVRMDMRTLGFASRVFDGLWVCASFLHVPREDAAETLAGFRRVLRPGGVLFCAVQRGEGERDTEASPYEADDERRFTLYGEDEFRSLVASAGFERVETSVDDDHWIQSLARVPGRE